MPKKLGFFVDLVIPLQYNENNNIDMLSRKNKKEIFE
jgi:hypothetical protein